MDDRALQSASFKTTRKPPTTIAAFMRGLRQKLQGRGTGSSVGRTLASRPGVAAIVTLGVAWGLVMHQMGWAQMGHFDQVQAFSKGQAQIDQWHWDTNDKAWVDGHFYSVKSPGVAALTTPLYMAIKDLGGGKLARSAANNAAQTAHPKWYPSSVVPLENYGYDVQRGLRVQRIVEQSTPIVWSLDLLAAVIPAILLLLLVRWAADRFLPGYGTAAAITLGLATVVMTFAAEFFSHVISAGIAFAAFCVLMKERDGPPRWGLVAFAGLLAGLAVTFEFQTGLVGVVLFGYALSRKTGRADARLRITDWVRRGDGVRRRHHRGRAADAGLQLLGVRQSAQARLRRRGRLPRGDRTRRARPQQPRLLRHHRASLRQRHQPAVCGAGAARAHTDHRHGDRGGVHDAPARAIERRRTRSSPLPPSTSSTTAATGCRSGAARPARAS